VTADRELRTFGNWSQRRVVAAVYVVSMFMSILDATIVIVALPTLSEEFGVATSSIEWVVTGYLLSLAVWIPASGWIGDRFGTKRTFLLALVLFTGGSVLCGLASTLGLLIAFRVVQGAGGGMLAPVGLAMLFRVFPPERRAAASRVLVIPTALAPAAGPVVGGLLIDTLSWRWIFWVNVPIGVAAFAFGLLYLREHREPTAGRFDLPGFVLSATGLALLLYALSEGPASGWGSPVVVASAFAAMACFALLALVELRVREPMLPLRLLRNRLFRVTNIALLLCMAAFVGTLFVVPIFLQDVRDESALATGLTTFPEALGVIAVSQVAARLYPYVGPRRLMISGLVGMAAVLVLLSRIDLSTSLWTIRILLFALGAGFSFMVIALQAASFATISPADTGRASAFFNTQRQVGSALGVAILATALSVLLPDGGTPAEQVTAYQGVLLLAAVIALLAAAVSWRVPDADAAATLHPRHRHRAGAEPALLE
jgi:EmrB/QacA subfamily drug resistance transporter